MICGLTLLWLVLERLEPKTVLDVRELERTITSTKLHGPPCDGDVRLYLSTLKNALDELKSKHGDSAMTDHKFTEHVFDGLKAADNEQSSSFFKEKASNGLLV